MERVPIRAVESGSRVADREPVRSSDASGAFADRWIVSRFNRAVEEANAALAAYRFDQYAKACYDFFWRDFCDWYVEAIKPAMKDPARAGQTANVLAAVLDGALRLMHPMIPFITETIWWRLNEVRPQRGLPGRIECPPSKRLVLAGWPTGRRLRQAAEFVFPKLQEVIVAIRNIRNEYKVDVKQPVTASINAPEESAGPLRENRELIELLATCELKEVGSNPTAGPIPRAEWPRDARSFLRASLTRRPRSNAPTRSAKRSRSRSMHLSQGCRARPISRRLRRRSCNKRAISWQRRVPSGKSWGARAKQSSQHLRMGGLGRHRTQLGGH